MKRGGTSFIRAFRCFGLSLRAVCPALASSSPASSAAADAAVEVSAVAAPLARIGSDKSLQTEARNGHWWQEVFSLSSKLIR